MPGERPPSSQATRSASSGHAKSGQDSQELEYLATAYGPHMAAALWAYHEGTSDKTVHRPRPPKLSDSNAGASLLPPYPTTPANLRRN